MLAFALLASLASVVPTALAHGYVDTLTTSGGTFSGYLPYQVSVPVSHPMRAILTLRSRTRTTTLRLTASSERFQEMDL